MKDPRATLAPLLVLFCLLPAAAAADDQPVPAVPADLAAEQAQADAILARAAEVQGGAEIQADLKSFQASFDLEVFDADRGRGNFLVERLFDYRDDSGRMWTEKRRSKDGPASFTVYNGEDAWRVGETGELAVFTHAPAKYKTDLDNLMDDVKLTAQVFRYFFVRSLDETVKDIRFVRKDMVAGRAVSILEGTAEAWLGGDERTRVFLKILIDAEENTVSEVKLTDLADTSHKRAFRFERYARNSQGVLVPGQIKVYGKDEANHEMQIALKVEARSEPAAGGKPGARRMVPRIEFNVPIPEERFAFPAAGG